MTLGSNGGNTTLGFNSSRGNDGGFINLTSTYDPTSMNQSLGQWLNPSKQNMALIMHNFSSALILQITEPKKLSVLPLILPALYAGGSLTTTGTIALSGIGGILLKKGLEGTRESLDSRKGAYGQMPDPNDDEERKKKHYEVPKSQKGLRDFIDKAERTGSGLKSDPFHRASSFGTQPTTNIEVQKIIGNDGNSYVRLVQEATVNDQRGICEYLVNSEGKITHQLFRKM